MNTQARETDLLTRIFTAQHIGQTCKHWCFAKQGFAIVTRTDSGFAVKMPGSRKAVPMNQDDAITAIVSAHHG